MTNTHHHIPVLAEEILHLVTNIKARHVLDGTFGVGALTSLILEKTDAHIYVLDCDPDAIERAHKLSHSKPGRITVMHGHFSQLNILLKKHEAVLDAAIFDCGVSSPQIDQGHRGFSFQKDGPLDMRMSQNGLSAYDIVNTWSMQDITHILKSFGEERHAKKIAKALVARRSKKTFETTKDLADFISTLVAKRGKTHPATRTFQSIRIAVNDEISEVRSAVKNTLPFLRNQGMLIMITFHSLEHKTVKNTMKEFAILDPGTSRYHPPVPQKGISHDFFVDGFQRCVKPSEDEISKNDRARSAQMRVCIKHEGGVPC